MKLQELVGSEKIVEAKRKPAGPNIVRNTHMDLYAFRGDSSIKSGFLQPP